MKVTSEKQFCEYCRKDPCITNCSVLVPEFRSTIVDITVLREIWLEDLENESYKYSGSKYTNYFTFYPQTLIVERTKSDVVIIDMESNHGNAVREKYPFLPEEIYYILRTLIFAE
ncbi:MAG: hypothetical protein V3U54_12895 [Thermodesulfobacteriota bacterium]